MSTAITPYRFAVTVPAGLKAVVMPYQDGDPGTQTYLFEDQAGEGVQLMIWPYPDAPRHLAKRHRADRAHHQRRGAAVVCRRAGVRGERSHLQEQQPRVRRRLKRRVVCLARQPLPALDLCARRRAPQTAAGELDIFLTYAMANSCGCSDFDGGARGAHRPRVGHTNDAQQHRAGRLLVLQRRHLDDCARLLGQRQQRDALAVRRCRSGCRASSATR